MESEEGKVEDHQPPQQTDQKENKEEHRDEDDSNPPAKKPTPPTTEVAKPKRERKAASARTQRGFNSGCKTTTPAAATGIRGWTAPTTAYHPMPEYDIFCDKAARKYTANAQFSQHWRRYTHGVQEEHEANKPHSRQLAKRAPPLPYIARHPQGVLGANAPHSRAVDVYIAEHQPPQRPVVPYIHTRPVNTTRHKLRTTQSHSARPRTTPAVAPAGGGSSSDAASARRFLDLFDNVAVYRKKEKAAGSAEAKQQQQQPEGGGGGRKKEEQEAEVDDLTKVYLGVAAKSECFARRTIMDKEHKARRVYSDRVRAFTLLARGHIAQAREFHDVETGQRGRLQQSQATAWDKLCMSASRSAKFAKHHEERFPACPLLTCNHRGVIPAAVEGAFLLNLRWSGEPDLALCVLAFDAHGKFMGSTDMTDSIRNPLNGNPLVRSWGAFSFKCDNNSPSADGSGAQHERHLSMEFLLQHAVLEPKHKRRSGSRAFDDANTAALHRESTVALGQSPKSASTTTRGGPAFNQYLSDSDVEFSVNYRRFVVAVMNGRKCGAPLGDGVNRVYLTVCAPADNEPHPKILHTTELREQWAINAPQGDGQHSACVIASINLVEAPQPQAQQGEEETAAASPRGALGGMQWVVHAHNLCLSDCPSFQRLPSLLSRSILATLQDMAAEWTEATSAILKEEQIALESTRRALIASSEEDALERTVLPLHAHLHDAVRRYLTTKAFMEAEAARELKKKQEGEQKRTLSFLYRKKDKDASHEGPKKKKMEFDVDSSDSPPPRSEAKVMFTAPEAEEKGSIT